MSYEQPAISHLKRLAVCYTNSKYTKSSSTNNNNYNYNIINSNNNNNSSNVDIWDVRSFTAA
ncbi:putative uncharacterized protein DDB_G0277445 [Drosophila nasuta]|uniref:putative uncharacterized protein DDB_G0277445 n=1 Tax=Drosophila nasuta TaxID=42062 RepID=UPI00295F3C1C|nr:putative uncharacterized protein DDB_G0277445 [Drosophila nasuta]